MSFQSTFFDELEKQAVIGTAITGAAAHLGMNAAVKAIGTKRTGLAGKLLNPAHNWVHKKKTEGMAEGIRRGLKGESPLTTKGKITRSWGVPELTAGAEPGHKIGDELATIRPSHRYRRLRKMRQAMLKSDHAKHAPIGENAVGAITKTLADKDAMRSPRRSRPGHTKKDVAGHIGAVAAGLPTIPLTAGKSAIHGALNVARVGTAKSKVGRDFAAKGFKEGLKGKLPSKGKQRFYDYAVSPSALDSHRLGHAVSKETPANQLRLAHSYGRVTPHSTKVQSRSIASKVHSLAHKTPIEQARLKSKAEKALSEVPSKVKNKFKEYGGKMLEKKLSHFQNKKD
jgi:hypothetical protein